MFSAKKFWSYCWGTIACPRGTFKYTTGEGNKVAYGFAAVMVLSILYSVSVLIGYGKGLSPVGYEPFLRIPAESYYLWQTFFTIPVGLIGWILFVGSAQLLSRTLGGQGTFEDSLAVLGFPFILMLPFGWFPEMMVMSFAPEWWGTPAWGTTDLVLVGVSTLWFLIASAIALRQAQNLSLSRAVFAALVSLVPVMGVQMTYLHQVFSETKKLHFPQAFLEENCTNTYVSLIYPN